MVLLQKPTNSGQMQDIYECLDTAYGGEAFEEAEAIAMVSQALGISDAEARSGIQRLVSNGCVQ
jgi:hypothetical protein